MSIYLEHRMARSKAGPFKRIRIGQTAESSTWEDIRAELSDVYPEALILEGSAAAQHGPCELVVIPYEDGRLGPSKVCEGIRCAQEYSATHVMFYGVKHRTVDVVAVSEWWSFWAGRAVERIAVQVVRKLGSL